MNKVCTKCKAKYPATLDYFYKHNQKKDGLRPDCKGCTNKAQKRYNQSKQGRESHRRACQKYDRTHKDKVNEYARNHRKVSLIAYLRYKFQTIKQRCNNPKNIAYPYYGKRGIKCLFKSSDEFVDYVINALEVDPRGLDIDRIDNNGHYKKGNIRFITHLENCNNKRQRR